MKIKIILIYNHWIFVECFAVRIIGATIGNVLQVYFCEPNCFQACDFDFLAYSSIYELLYNWMFTKHHLVNLHRV